MIDRTFSTTTMDMLEKGLDTAVLRQQVLANNISNADTPNFKRSDVIFEAELKRAVESQKKENSNPELNTLYPEHFSNSQPKEWQRVHPVTHTDYLSSMRNDGNNVDIENEVSQLVKNQMQYSLIVERLGSQFRLMNSLIRTA